MLGRAAARDIAGTVPLRAGPVPVVLSVKPEAVDAAKMAVLREAMSRHVGVMRDTAGSAAALGILAALDGEDTPPAFANMVAAATIIAAAAYLRPASCGAHCRTDNVETGAVAPSLLTLREARALRDSLMVTI